MRNFLTSHIAIILIPILTQACIPSLSKSFLEIVNSFLFTSKNAQSGYSISVNALGVIGSGLSVSLNDSEKISIPSDGKYTFALKIPSGGLFKISIVSQPSSPLQACSISGAEGTIVSGSVDTITINCSPELYTLAGTASGLEGSGLRLSLNGSTTINVNVNGVFAFPGGLSDSVAYSVTVVQNPNHPTQTCTLTNDIGTITSANVSNLLINCVSIAYPIQVSLTGLTSGTLSLVMQGQTLNLSSNGVYLFPNDIPIGENYSLSINSQPNGYQCSITPNLGTIVSSTVIVDANCFSILSQTPTNGSMVLPNESVRFVFSSDINVGSCVGVGPSTLNVVAGSPVFSLATTNFPNDTLVVSPSPSTWSPGASNTISLDCTSNDGKVLAAGSRVVNYLVPSTIRYVSDATGNDLNDGLTVSTPKRTIQDALATFVSCPTKDCAILIESGAYDPTLAGNDSLILNMNGVSLMGSYTPGTSFTVRNPTARNSNIVMSTVPISCNTSSLATPCSALTITNAVTAVNRIDGFTITSGDGVPVSVGAVIDGAPIISNTSILGGSSISLYSIGVFIRDASPTIFSSSGMGGVCSTVSCLTVGMKLDVTSVGVSPNISLSTFSGNTCNASSCKSKGLEYTSTVSANLGNVRGNSFVGGNSSSGSTISYGIDANGNFTGTIESNTIRAGNAEQSCGIRWIATAPINIGSVGNGNYISSGNSVTVSYGILANATGAGGFINGNEIETKNSTNTTGTLSSYALSLPSGTGAFIVKGNQIITGNSTVTAVGNGAFSYAIYMTSPANGSYLVGNKIILGNVIGDSSGTTNYGIYLNGSSSLKVYNNTIEGGTSSHRMRGIEVSGNFSAAEIIHNTISSGVGLPNQTSSLFLSNVNNLFVENNIFINNEGSATNYCVNLTNAAVIGSLRFNHFYNCPNMVYESTSTFSFDTICPSGYLGIPGCGSTLGGANYSQNTNGNPELISALTSPFNFQFTTLSSCSITKVANTIAAVSSDFYNKSRPGSDGFVSKGAMEYNGICIP